MRSTRALRLHAHSHISVSMCPNSNVGLSTVTVYDYSSFTHIPGTNLDDRTHDPNSSPVTLHSWPCAASVSALLHYLHFKQSYCIYYESKVTVYLRFLLHNNLFIQLYNNEWNKHGIVYTVASFDSFSRLGRSFCRAIEFLVCCRLYCVYCMHLGHVPCAETKHWVCMLL